ncbi:zinc finger protein CO3-like [Lolium rigidum]|uniref:zinc finger protein CO3-like n=1 Tax=Lolium rigidum TaxID=89674 RepID=UPI001F5DC836|nr:zinc finger protein CO3-like [Lolium rigidum]
MANGGGGRRRKGARRGKTKKKTKYLSLSRHLAQAAEVVVHRPESPSVEESLPLEAPSAEETLEEDGGGHEQQQQQLDPFALHPEAPSTLFAAAPSLNDILGASSFSSGGGSGGSSPCAPSPDASGGSGRFEGEEEDLARRALRGRERWVYCRSSSSSPSAATATTTTTTTTSSSCSSAASTGAASARPPLLKLDYDEILAAWAGRGSLYIGAAPGLPAPKLEPDSVLVEVAPGRQAAAAWVAPDATGRAERVRRYKEKRHARLFSKRIRYEVRRINAVRRPRLKGRFIRGNEGVAMAT